MKKIILSLFLIFLVSSLFVSLYFNFKTYKETQKTKMEYYTCKITRNFYDNSGKSNDVRSFILNNEIGEMQDNQGDVLYYNFSDNELYIKSDTENTKEDYYIDRISGTLTGFGEMGLTKNGIFKAIGSWSLSGECKKQDKPKL